MNLSKHTRAQWGSLLKVPDDSEENRAASMLVARGEETYRILVCVAGTMLKILIAKGFKVWQNRPTQCPKVIYCTRPDKAALLFDKVVVTEAVEAENQTGKHLL